MKEFVIVYKPLDNDEDNIDFVKADNYVFDSPDGISIVSFYRETKRIKSVDWYSIKTIEELEETKNN